MPEEDFVWECSQCRTVWVAPLPPSFSQRFWHYVDGVIMNSPTQTYRTQKLAEARWRAGQGLYRGKRPNAKCPGCGRRLSHILGSDPRLNSCSD